MISWEDLIFEDELRTCGLLWMHLSILNLGLTSALKSSIDIFGEENVNLS